MLRLVIGIHSLAGQGGTEQWVTTVGDHLQRVGHDVWIYAAEDGVTGELARGLGLRTAIGARELPDDIDAMLPQDVVAALELAGTHAHVPQVFVSHSHNFDVQLVPQLPDVTKGVVTLYDRAEQRVAASAVVPPIRRLRQPVDVERFRPLRPIAEQPRVALALGNYLAGERLDLLRAACEQTGIELRQVGAGSGSSTVTPELAINEADIVFGKAKVIHEAMACGRAAFIYDISGCEGWVTADNYASLVGDNFAGRTASLPVTVDSLVEALGRYDSEMGLVNRDLMVAHHAAPVHTAQLVEAIREFVGERESGQPRQQAEFLELARLARTSWRHESDAFAMRSHAHDMATRAQRLEADVHRLELDVERLQSFLDDADAALRSVHESSRWRLVQRIFRPFDKLRGRA